MTTETCQMTTKYYFLHNLQKKMIGLHDFSDSVVHKSVDIHHESYLMSHL